MGETLIPMNILVEYEKYFYMDFIESKYCSVESIMKTRNESRHLFNNKAFKYI